MELYIKTDKQHKLVSLSEAAKILGIKTSTLNAYLNRKQRPYRTIKLSDKKFIFEEDLNGK